MLSKTLIILLLALSHFSFANDELKLYTEDYPPLNYFKDGKLIGPAIDIVQAIQNDIKSNHTVEALPWKRAILTTLKNKNRAIFSFARSPSREPLFKWVGPIAVKSYALYSLKKNNLVINSLNNIADFTVGVQEGSIAQEFIQTQGKIKIYSVIKPLQSLKMLMKNRIDFWYTDSGSIANLAQKMHVPISLFAKSPVIKKAKLYIAFNKSTADETVTLWQKTYQKLYETKVIESIYTKDKMLNLYPENLNFSATTKVPNPKK